MTTLESRALDPANDTDALIDLFDTVFGFTVSPAMWEWKYRPPWAPRHFCWVGAVDGQIVGFLGAVPLRGTIDGEEVPFFQLADVMVHPAHRLKHDYFSIGQGAVRDDITKTHPRHLVYGFSDHRAFRWFERLGWVSVVEKPVTTFALPARNGTPNPYSIREWAWDEPEIDGVWGFHSANVRIGLIRDGAYLRWRYGGHPVFPYRLLGLYREEAPVGWLVLGRGGKDKDGKRRPAPVVDMLGPTGESEAMLTAVATWLDEAVKTWLPGWVDVGALERKPTTTHVYHFRENSAVDSAALQHRLYYTMGDVDWW